MEREPAESYYGRNWPQKGPKIQKSSRPLESLQKTRYATSRNPRNGAAILAVLRLNLLARPVAATKVEGSAGRVWSAVSFQRSAFGVIFVTSPRFADKLQTKTLCSRGEIKICLPGLVIANRRLNRSTITGVGRS